VFIAVHAQELIQLTRLTPMELAKLWLQMAGGWSTAQAMWG